MKTAMISIFFSILTNFALAQDMSHSEKWGDAFREFSDGSTQYVGKCSLHEDYLNTHFVKGKTLVAYFEPDYRASSSQTLARFHHIDTKLLLALVYHLTKDTNLDYLADVDDITLDKIKSIHSPELNLYRFNVGVGGGNGMYVVFEKIGTGTQASYKLISDVFDGEVLFCDQSVGMSKE